MQCDGTLERKNNVFQHDPKSFKLCFSICATFEMGSVPFSGVTQGGCALILTTKCHCSFITVAEFETNVKKTIMSVRRRISYKYETPT